MQYALLKTFSPYDLKTDIGVKYQEDYINKVLENYDYVDLKLIHLSDTESLSVLIYEDRP